MTAYKQLAKNSVNLDRFLYYTQKVYMRLMLPKIQFQ